MLGQGCVSQEVRFFLWMVVEKLDPAERSLRNSPVSLDMRELENYLHLLINNEALRNKMAEQSRSRALACYSFKAVAKQYDDLWLDLGRIARSIVVRPALVRFDRPRYYHFFGHYASKTISDETPLEITAAGREIGRAKKIVPAYPPFLSAYQILDEDVLRRALELLRGCDGSFGKSDVVAMETHSRARMGSLVESLGKTQSYHPDHLRRHIMWLMKYGFIVALDSQ